MMLLQFVNTLATTVWMHPQNGVWIIDYMAFTLRHDVNSSGFKAEDFGLTLNPIAHKYTCPFELVLIIGRSQVKVAPGFMK